MLADALKRHGLVVIVDRRANARRGPKPESAEIVHRTATSTKHLVDEMAGDLPMLVVAPNGRVILLSASSSVIVVEGDEETSEQSQALTKIRAALRDLGIKTPAKRKPRLEVVTTADAWRDQWPTEQGDTNEEPAI